jgi:hypothetical protein
VAMSLTVEGWALESTLERRHSRAYRFNILYTGRGRERQIERERDGERDRKGGEVLDITSN